ncbi:uncharacterized protein C8R40DRAFT_1171935 [Lentinula edodes]|uniref:uncharacterized protein n=1 Tax=Lentinula edodes TaxID=5353 RepID=UPI001E8EB348|nr:uncharacterized protein C8R40DRAFT_1171935 [Lentinula edodes]KAH7874008.1 hypothetical protein C8R40DRAFT_1171935 [Lentinula edodes]
MNFPQSQTDIEYMYTLGTLILVAGVPPQQFADYLVGFNPQVISVSTFLLGPFPTEINPTTVIILLGPALDLISSSLLSNLSQFLPHFTSLINIEIRIHDSVWSRRLVDKLPIFPPSVKNAKMLVSNLLPNGPELVRIVYNANATPFATTFAAAFYGMHLAMKGHRASDLSFMLALHEALAAVDLQENCVVEIEISHGRSMFSRVSGRLRDVCKVVECVMDTAATPELASRLYAVKSLVVDVPMLHHRDEFGHFVHAVHSKAPRLQILEVNFRTVNSIETHEWMGSVRMLDSLRELIRIVIAHPHPLDLTDADVARLLRSWRKVEHVSLNPKASGALITHRQVLLTINALRIAAFQAPTSLRHLSLFLNADEDSVHGFSGLQPRYDVEKIELRLATPSTHRARVAIRVAETLFPNANIKEV